MATITFTFSTIQEGTVLLVHEEDGADTLSNSLAEHSLDLDTDTRHTINNHKGSISDTESSSRTAFGN